MYLERFTCANGGTAYGVRVWGDSFPPVSPVATKLLPRWGNDCVLMFDGFQVLCCSFFKHQGISPIVEIPSYAEKATADKATLMWLNSNLKRNGANPAGKAGQAATRLNRIG
jgi:hypothetical protein